MLLSCMLPASATFPELVAQAQLAEELGYDTIAVNHIAARDSFSALSALATATERVQLAVTVAPIYHRSPASMAQSAATVDDVSGGRFTLGLGVGHRLTMGGWHGQEIGSPAAELREYVALVRDLLAGAEPATGRRWNSTFRFNGLSPRPDMPILLAALSPAMLRLAGEIADGVVLWACPADYVRDVVIPEVAKGRAESGKTLDGFAVMPAVPAAVGDPAQAAAGAAQERDRPGPALASRLQASPHVLGVAAGGQGDQHVAGADVRAHLPREDLLEAVVVAEGGHHRGVGRQGQGRQRPPLA